MARTRDWLYIGPGSKGSTKVMTDGYILVHKDGKAPTAEGVGKLQEQALGAAGFGDRPPDVFIDLRLLRAAVKELTEGRYIAKGERLPLAMWKGDQAAGPVVVAVLSDGYQDDRTNYAIVMPILWEDRTEPDEVSDEDEAGQQHDWLGRVLRNAIGRYQDYMSDMDDPDAATSAAVVQTLEQLEASDGAGH